MQADLAVGGEFNLRQRGFRARTEVLLHAGKTDAIALARMRQFKFELLLRPIHPQRMHLCLLQNFVDADRAGRHRALSVFHARAQRVLQAEVDRINAKLFGDFIDHHLGGRHALQRAVASR